MSITFANESKLAFIVQQEGSNEIIQRLSGLDQATDKKVQQGWGCLFLLINNGFKRVSRCPSFVMR
jgi:hypothetical protein